MISSTTENVTVWLRPELVTLSTSIQTSSKKLSQKLQSLDYQEANVSVRFWQQWRGTINIKQPYIKVSKLNICLDYDANITK